ncbi:MAG: MFS transporter [Rhodobacteraceae bacterium]|nr:MFS transporter [Paracoccaceae bacterium]
MGAAAQFGKIAVSLDEFRTIYSVGEVGLGFLISCVGLVGLVFGVAGGILIPLIGIRRAFVWGMFGAAMLSALQAVHLQYFALIVLRILEGASHLLIVVAGPILMARHSSVAARGAVMTLWSSFFGLSYMLVALIAPALLTLGGTSALFVAGNCEPNTPAPSCIKSISSLFQRCRSGWFGLAMARRRRHI